MSYCRWSTNDFQCDVYTYADVSGGYTTHVASRRRVYHAELPPKLDFYPDTEERVRAWLDRQRAVSEIPHDLVPIGLPYDGETFNDPTPQDAADRLQWLKDMGYMVPNGVIEALRMEAEDDA